jgi:hypothetical protein
MNRHTIFSQANRRRYLLAFLIYITKNREKKLLLLRETLPLGSKYYFFSFTEINSKILRLLLFNLSAAAALVVDMIGGVK